MLVCKSLKEKVCVSSCYLWLSGFEMIELEIGLLFNFFPLLLFSPPVLYCTLLIYLIPSKM